MSCSLLIWSSDGPLTGPSAIGQIPNQIPTNHQSNSQYSIDGSGPVLIQSLTVPGPFYHESVNPRSRRRRVLPGPCIEGIRVEVETSSSESEMQNLNQHTGGQASSLLNVQVCQFTLMHGLIQSINQIEGVLWAPSYHHIYSSCNGPAAHSTLVFRITYQYVVNYQHRVSRCPEILFCATWPVHRSVHIKVWEFQSSSA